ncbi:unnamed protein product [Polarella glacialis]|uniref:Polynucleotide adenylyltransferase n=1 Tax=Polarella glacialis TaxID=89957 RepID=A0A813JNS3_POLGL|nr:unnamed protein product [Polarella glacialis]
MALDSNCYRQVKNLEEALLVQLEAVYPLQQERQRHFFCIQQMEQCVQLLGPGWHVRPFGSAANTLCTRGADLDLTCFHESVRDQDSHLATQELRYKLLPLLRCHPRFKIKEEIWSARVPIVKLLFDETTEVDLSCHNPQALQNTYLLKAYAELSPQVRRLVLAVKVWARTEGVCGAPSGHLSSYSLTLMVLYFLQVQQGLEMPCMPTEAFSSFGSTPEVQGISWTCALPLAELVTGFFVFYAGADGGFQWGSEVVSVRLGRRSQPRELDFQLLPGRLGHRLHIEDPFLLARNLNCVLTPENEQLLRAKLKQTATTICSGGIPSAFVPTPLESQASEKAASHPGKADTDTAAWLGGEIHAGIYKDSPHRGTAGGKLMSNADVGADRPSGKHLDQAALLQKPNHFKVGADTDTAAWLGGQTHAGIYKDSPHRGTAGGKLMSDADVGAERPSGKHLDQAALLQKPNHFKVGTNWVFGQDTRDQAVAVISDSESTRSGSGRSSSSSTLQQGLHCNDNFTAAWSDTYAWQEETSIDPYRTSVRTERFSAAKAWLDQASDLAPLPETLPSTLLGMRFQL